MIIIPVRWTDVPMTPGHGRPTIRLGAQGERTFEVSVRIKARGRRAVAGGAAAALAGLALAAGPASAANGDFAQITSPPSVPATAYVGETLTATGATWETNRTPEVTFRWVRCADAVGWSDCAPIGGGTGPSYTPTAADKGLHLLVWLRVRSGRAVATAFSERTAAVTDKPPPEPKPEPTPPPVTVTPPADIVPPDTTTPTPPTGAVAGEQAALKWLSPFPVVRIKGWLTASGARVTTLTVRAPRGARIKVRCAGSGCPRKRYARMTKLVHLRPYQRLLRGNVRLEISVTRKGYVGKRTIITLRRGKAPKRRDLCLYPGVTRARSCTQP
jgi:hypothetical protein